MLEPASELDDWSLSAVTGIGKTDRASTSLLNVSGHGISPSGHTSPWAAVIPAPATTGLGLALALAAARGRR